MRGNDTSTNKIHNIITHFLTIYEDAEQLGLNNEVIAKVFIHATLNERLFDEKRRIIEPLPSPNQEALLQHAIEQLCDLKTPESIHNFIERVVNLDSTKYRIEIPYEDITSFIYDFEGDIPVEAIDERLGEFSSVLKDNVKHLSDYKALKVEKVYKKFERHIKLAIGQKKYINKQTKEAAILAEEIAKKAKGTATFARDAAAQANISSQNAQSLAQKAENLANEADAQAKSTIANYISILGIFASIIFTLFGGVNLIGSTVKLLEVNSRWPYLTFIIALLMICLLTLLNMMVKWINSMSNLKSALEKQNKEDKVAARKCRLFNPFTWDFYTKAVFCFLIILFISLCGMYHVNKENLFSITKETTTKNVPKAEENNQPVNKSKLESQNKEVTVVEKITVSNHVNDKDSDKDKSD